MSKYFRKLVLKKLAKIYDISTGFCSVKYWTSKIERNVFELIQAIHNETFDTVSFDFEENYDKLIKRFRHMSLFSVCLHFSRCRRSCEKRHGYCKVCSRVRENCFYDYKNFENLIMTSSDTEYLHITSSNRVDHDVFVNSPSYFEYLDYELINGKCCQLEVFSYARDLFAVFSAVLVRMYLNYSIEYFLELISQVSLSNEGKIVRKIFWFPLDLLHKFFEINYLFYYEFFNVFDEVNSSKCYVNDKKNQNLTHMAHL